MLKRATMAAAVVLLLSANNRVSADTWGTLQIKYVTWDGTQWTATIQNIVRQAKYGINNIEVGHSIIDPDFKHYENGNKDTDPQRQSDHIDYIADNGTDWTAKIHTKDGVAYWEHCPHPSGSCHYDPDKKGPYGHIRFQTWDGTCLQGTLQPLGPVPDKDPGTPVNITFESIPCTAKH